MENYDDKAYKRAKKRVDDVKGFYIHLVTYIIINFFFVYNKFNIHSRYMVVFIPTYLLGGNRFDLSLLRNFCI
nr:2TM domain-containing protein [Methanobrevibacter arboriphilus]